MVIVGYSTYHAVFMDYSTKVKKVEETEETSELGCYRTLTREIACQEKKEWYR